MPLGGSSWVLRTASVNSFAQLSLYFWRPRMEILSLRPKQTGASLKCLREHLNLPAQGGIKSTKQRLLRVLALQRYRLHLVRLFLVQRPPTRRSNAHGIPPV